jgi:hypothetical protein
MREALTAFAARLVFGLLLRREPLPVLDPAKRSAFESAAAAVLAGDGATLAWEWPYPKHEFTRYLVAHHPVLLHGTPRTGVERLEPAEQTLANGRRATAVFATDDGIWPIFFATIDRAGYPGPYSLRNAAMVVGRGVKERRYYLFSMDHELHRARVLSTGEVLVLPRATFRETGLGTVRFPEWVSDAAVEPLGRLEVGPEDFPFQGQISAHRPGEWFPLTWLLYRWRTR